MIHSEIYTFNPSSLFPLFSLTTRWRLDRHWSFLDILPISAKRSASTLLEAFHHCPFGVIVGISEQILEELIQRAIAAHVGVICARFRLLGVENGVGHAVPVYTGLWKGRTGLCGRSGVRSGRIGKRIGSIAYETTPSSMRDLGKTDLNLDFTYNEAGLFRIDLTL